MPNRLIVKLRGPEGGAIAPAAVMRMQPGPAEPTEADRRQLGSLMALNEEFGLARIRGLFFDFGSDAGRSPAQVQEAVVARIRGRFPGRSNRADGRGTLPDLTRYYVLEFEEGVDLGDAIRGYRGDPLVESVQRDRYVSVDDGPDDPFFHSSGTWGQPQDDLWGLKLIGVERAWERSKGAGILVAVVDSGVDFDHPDLAGNLWTNPGEIPDNGRDDDENGFIDDVRGWDFSNGDNDPTDDTAVGHGTHVAGIVAAVGDNGIGVIGVAPESRVMAVKGVGRDGKAEFSALAQALFYATANGADVINNSWGPGTTLEIPSAVEDAVRFAHGLGAVVVFAAGNDSDVVAQQSPLNLPESITVGASTPDDRKLPPSNWGRELDVVAPGGSDNVPPPSDQPRRSVLSLRAASVADPTGMSPVIVGERYLRLSGTSMAAPHVSGLAALILSTRPGFSNEDVRQAIRASAVDVGASGFDLLHGFGRIDAGAALEVAYPPEVRIEHPAENARLDDGSLAIRGSVAGEGVQSARLLLSPLGDLGASTAIREEIPAPSDGVLATLEATALAEGPYLIRLVATDREGRRFEDAVQVYRQTTAIERLTDDAARQGEPAVSANFAAWAEVDPDRADGPDAKLVLLDLRDRSRRELPLPAGEPAGIALSDSHLVYQAIADDRNASTIRVVDLAVGADRPIQELDSTMPVLGLAISGDRVVWLAETGRVLVHEISNGRTRSASEGRPAADLPHLDGDRVVWTELTDVVLHDLRDGATTSLAPPGDGVFYEPSISGDDVVWKHDPDRSLEQFEVFHRDLRSGQTRRIVEARPGLRSLRVSAGRVVWSDFSRGNRDLFVHDLATGRTRAVTAGNDFDDFPALSGRNLAWSSFRRRASGAEEGYVPDIDFHRFPAEATPARAGFSGGARLLGQIGVASNVAPDRHAATALFDSFSVALLPGVGSPRVATRTEVISLPVSGIEEEIGVRQFARGYASIDPGVRALLVVDCCGRTEVKDLSGTVGDYQLEFDGRLRPGQGYEATVVLLIDRADAGQAAGGYLTIDSFDALLDPEDADGGDVPTPSAAPSGGSG